MTLKSRSTAGPITVGYWDGVQVGIQLLPGSDESIETFGNNLSFLGSVDCGGPMLLRRQGWAYALGKWQPPIRWAGSDVIISGGPTSPVGHPEPPSNLELNTQGATAIAHTVPTAPVFNGLASMAEVAKDGIPSIVGVQSWREQTNVARKAGGEYLNVEYGWLPLVSDMRNFARAVKRHHSILSDLKAGSGKWTRDGYSFPSQTTFEAQGGTCFIYMASDSGKSAVANCNLITYQENRTWFKGAFSYVLPASDTQLGKAALYASYADKLLGVKPTPAAIWQATPWSWALDWFTNAGDVMTNISQLGQNGTVLEYGYMMSTCKTSYTINHAAGIYNTAGSRTLLREYKKRYPANPYGFGVTNESLTAAQVAIVAALGLSHSGGKG